MQPTRRSIVLTGRTGQVGRELERALAPIGHVVATDRNTLDLADADSIRLCIRNAAPALIVNAAAYTRVDQAEQEPDLAMAVNGAAPGIMAEEARALGIPLVHYSTDYVFDGRGNATAGTRPRPYCETDTPAPLNQYGRSKLAGERAIQAVGPQHLILRTSWVYSNRGANFLRTVRRLAGERDEFRIVDDQTGSPTWARAIAQATVAILAASWVDQATDRKAGPPLSEADGLYHLSAADSTTWCGFARAIVEIDAAVGRGRKVRVTGIPTSEYPLPAARPAYSVLDSAAIKAAYCIALPGWRQQLVECLEE
jgi:dTDP-4-dehydrorhamnose reductase